MSKPYSIVSDLHFHNWSVFSEVQEGKVNSRLQTQIDEVKRAVKMLKKHGGDTMYNGGDTFHVRGKVDTTVLNPVVDLFRWIQDEGVTIRSIPGNHDLAGKDSDVIGNAANALVGEMSIMANQFRIYHDDKVIMFPWFSSLDNLKEMLEGEVKEGYTAIIHAPVNDIIIGIPDTGLDAKYLSSLGYKKVFCGHYHNRKNLGGGVYSIGAMCHQTWSDVGSTAGFMLVEDDNIKQFASHAPSFVDVYGDMTEEELLSVDGNYVRARVGKATPAQVNDLREDLKKRGAAGIIIQAIKDTEVKERDSSPVGESLSLEQSVAVYIADNFPKNTDLGSLCNDILSEVETVE